MVHYKLYYFPVRNLAEVTRQLFALAGVEYEDIRITMEEWPVKREEFVMKQMPVLEVDGVQIPQSWAVARYVARKYGYAGKTPEEEALADGLGDAFKDFYGEIKTFFYTAAGLVPGDKEELKKSVFSPARDKFFFLLTEYLKKSKTGFLAGGDLTWVDLVIADALVTYLNLVPDCAKFYPELLEHQKKVHAIPAIKKWIEARPETPF